MRSYRGRFVAFQRCGHCVTVDSFLLSAPGFGLGFWVELSMWKREPGRHPQAKLRINLVKVGVEFEYTDFNPEFESRTRIWHCHKGGCRPGLCECDQYYCPCMGSPDRPGPDCSRRSPNYRESKGTMERIAGLFASGLGRF